MLCPPSKNEDCARQGTCVQRRRVTKAPHLGAGLERAGYAHARRHGCQAHRFSNMRVSTPAVGAFGLETERGLAARPYGTSTGAV